MNFLLVRYAFMGIIAIEALVMPALLSERDYVSYEFTKQLILFAPMLPIGYISGILVRKYKDGAKTEPRNHLLPFLAVAVLYALIYGDLLLAVSAFIVIFLFSMEKVYIGEGHFIIASAQKVFISVLAVGFAVLGQKIPNLFTRPEQIAYASFVCGAVLWGIAFYRKAPTWHRKWFCSRAVLKSGYRVARAGFLLSVQTASLFLAILIIRDIVIGHSNVFSFEFFLILNFLQLVLVGVNTIAFSNQRDLGLITERRVLLRRLSLVCVVSLAAFAPTILAYDLYGTWILERSLDLKLYVMLGIPFIFFYAVSAFVNILYYRGQGSFITLVHIAMLGAIYGLSWMEHAAPPDDYILTALVASIFAAAALIFLYKLWALDFTKGQTA